MQPIETAELTAIPEGWPVGNPGPALAPAHSAAPAIGRCAPVLWDTGPSVPATHAWNLLALILTVTVVLKIYYVLLFPWVPDGWDALGYHTAARALVEEGLLTRDGYVIRSTASAYSFLLGRCTLWPVSTAVVRVIQVVPAVGIAVFVVLVTRRLFWDATARLAGAAAVLSPVWLYSAELSPTNCWLGLGTVCHNLVSHTLRQASSAGTNVVSSARRAGLMLGLLPLPATQDGRVVSWYSLRDTSGT